MIAVIFELQPSTGQKQAYLDRAHSLLGLAEQIDGFISVERFVSINDPDRLLSISYFRDEKAVAAWRQLSLHRQAQKAGRMHIFSNYRLRVAHVLRDYGKFDRAEAPVDSLGVHDSPMPRINNRCPGAP